MLYLLMSRLRACNNNIVSNLPRIAVTMSSILRASFEGAIRFRANSMHETRRAPFVQKNLDDA